MCITTETNNGGVEGELILCIVFQQPMSELCSNVHGLTKHFLAK